MLNDSQIGQYPGDNLLLRTLATNRRKVFLKLFRVLQPTPVSTLKTLLIPAIYIAANKKVAQASRTALKPPQHHINNPFTNTYYL